jgi:hypothetical protein
VQVEHPRGGVLALRLGGAVEQPWVIARTCHRTLACATHAPAELSLEPGGPVGEWDLASAAGFGQFFGGRGVQYLFAADGRMEVTLADSFVGTVDAVEVAKTVGTSGIVTGRWEVAGEGQLRIRGLNPSMLTLHGREAGGFAVPAQGFGPSQWLPAMCVEPWSWSRQDGRLVMKGRMFGAPVEVRLIGVG